MEFEAPVILYGQPSPGTGAPSWFTETTAPGAFDGCDLSKVKVYLMQGGETIPLPGARAELRTAGLYVVGTLPEGCAGPVERQGYAFQTKPFGTNWEAGPDETERRTVTAYKAIDEVTLQPAETTPKPPPNPR